MDIHFHTDHTLEGREGATAEFTNLVTSVLARYSDDITRVEVHLADENGDKGGADDKRCMMEARIRGHQPVAVTHHATTIDAAVNGAAHKLTRVVESTLARVRAVSSAQ